MTINIATLSASPTDLLTITTGHVLVYSPALLIRLLNGEFQAQVLVSGNATCLPFAAPTLPHLADLASAALAVVCTTRNFPDSLATFNRLLHPLADLAPRRGASQP